jgi:hypothetical protein
MTYPVQWSRRESNPRIQLGKLILHVRIVGIVVVAAAVLLQGQWASGLREKPCQTSAATSGATVPVELSAAPRTK